MANADVEALIAWRQRVREAHTLREVLTIDDGKLSAVEHAVLALAQEHTSVAQQVSHLKTELAAALNRLAASERLVHAILEEAAKVANDRRAP